VEKLSGLVVEFHVVLEELHREAAAAVLGLCGQLAFLGESAVSIISLPPFRLRHFISARPSFSGDSAFTRLGSSS
jgi:hypothetical protein